VKKKISLILASALVLAGCASIELDQRASKVIASPNPAPKGCKYVGQVNGNQGNFFTGQYTSNRNLEIGAMNDMKNQAAKLGANYVQMIVNRAGNTGSMSMNDGNGAGGMAQTNVTNMGNAYACPAKAIGLS
jgi:hypothetical protein